MVSRWTTLMRWRFGPGPVFWVEVRAGARRRRGYMARVAFVATLLVIPILGMFVAGPVWRPTRTEVQAMWLFGRAAFCDPGDDPGDGCLARRAGRGGRRLQPRPAARTA